MQALNNNSIKLKNENERSQIIEKIKDSYNKLSSSPKLKLGIIEPNEVGNSNKNSTEKQNENVDSQHVRGKKHFNNHTGQLDNVNMQCKYNYNNTNERIDDIIDFYKKINEKELKYLYNPQMYSYYNKEQRDPLLKYSQRIRDMQLSSENPNNKVGKF